MVGLPQPPGLSLPNRILLTASFIWPAGGFMRTYAPGRPTSTSTPRPIHGGNCVAKSRSSGSRSHGRATVRLATTVGALLLVFAAAGAGSEDSPAVSLIAQLVPGELTHKPAGVRRGARGRFSASFWPLRNERRGGALQPEHAAADRSRADSPHPYRYARQGRPCPPRPLQRRSLRPLGCVFQAYPKGLLRTMRLLGAYVDVHTKRNPRGELRGQIVFGSSGLRTPQHYVPRRSEPRASHLRASLGTVPGVKRERRRHAHDPEDRLGGAGWRSWPRRLAPRPRSLRPSGSLSSRGAASLHSPSCRSAPGR